MLGTLVRIKPKILYRRANNRPKYKPYGGKVRYVKRKDFIRIKGKRPRNAKNHWKYTILPKRFTSAKTSHSQLLSEVEDYRKWHPQGINMWPRTKSTVLAGISTYPREEESPKALPHRIGWVSPSKVLVCIRRKMRKEVLHARGIAGGSTSRFKKPRRNWKSEIVC